MSGPPGPPGGEAADASEVLAVSFNQDQSCLAVATTRGVKIFSLDAGLECVFEHRMGACRIAEMLFRSSLLVVVGAGETHDMSPRRLKVFNTSTRAVIADLPFPDTIAAVRLDRQKLVVVEARRATIFDLATLATQRTIATARNERGVVAMTADETGETSLVALPAEQVAAFLRTGTKANKANTRGDGPRDGATDSRLASRLGVVVVHDCLNHHAVCEIRAHRAPLAAMAFSSDGRFLATASERGTVVRVHVLPAADERLTKTFRRGVQGAVVRQIAFGPKTPNGGIALAASSEKGTVHVFRLATFEDDDEAVEKNASRRASDPDRTASDALGEAGDERKTKWQTWRALGVGAASATAKLAGAVSVKLAGAALGRELARSAADALDAEREVATVRLPAVSEGCEAARAKAAARGGFGVAGACAVRAAPASFAESRVTEDGNDEKSGGSIRVVAVNGDALLCEYSVGLDKNDTCCAVLERERCVARAEATTRDLATDFAAEASADGEPETADEKIKKSEAAARLPRRDWSGLADDDAVDGSPDDDSCLFGPVDVDPSARGVDLSASMSASMGLSIFLAKKE
jgi:autophagy-related protein 18